MIAIFDNNIGFLQFLSKAETAADAFAEFDATVGIDPLNKGLDKVAKDFSFYAVNSVEFEKMAKEGTPNCQPRGRKISY